MGVIANMFVEWQRTISNERINNKRLVTDLALFSRYNACQTFKHCTALNDHVI